MKAMKKHRRNILDDIFPICLDYSSNHKEEGCWRISLGGMRNYSPTGENWGYAPFEKRYKTEEEAKKVRRELWRTVKRWVNYFMPVDKN